VWACGANDGQLLHLTQPMHVDGMECDGTENPWGMLWLTERSHEVASPKNSIPCIAMHCSIGLRQTGTIMAIYLI
jgi:hypothetical protein